LSREQSDEMLRQRRSRAGPEHEILYGITMDASSYTTSALSYLPRTVVDLALLVGGASGRRSSR
ncbi:MAG TPA: hypothetical protein VF183_04205, partial [Acidimicrobiales bacterium]